MGRREIKEIQIKDVMIIECILFLAAANSSFPLPFAGKFDAGYDGDYENAIASYLYITLSYYIGRSIGTPVWMWASKSCEKRNILSCALIAITAFTFLFGICSSVYPAAFLRLMVGFFSIA